MILLNGKQISAALFFLLNMLKSFKEFIFTVYFLKQCLKEKKHTFKKKIQVTTKLHYSNYNIYHDKKTFLNVHEYVGKPIYEIISLKMEDQLYVI